MNKFYLDIIEEIKGHGLKIIGHDFNRPWGGFLIIDEQQSKDFIYKFITKENLKIKEKVSPKILIVNPNSRLSWQFHNRRKEIWKVYKNDVGVIRSMNDNQGKMKVIKQGEIIEFKNRERHRLIGLSNFGVVAEIWIHTNSNNPSDEHDIIRIEDDYSRE